MFFSFHAPHQRIKYFWKMKKIHEPFLPEKCFKASHLILYQRDISLGIPHFLLGEISQVKTHCWKFLGITTLICHRIDQLDKLINPVQPLKGATIQLENINCLWHTYVYNGAPLILRRNSSGLYSHYKDFRHFSGGMTWIYPRGGFSRPDHAQIASRPLSRWVIFYLNFCRPKTYPPWNLRIGQNLKKKWIIWTNHRFSRGDEIAVSFREDVSSSSKKCCCWITSSGPILAMYGTFQGFQPKNRAFFGIGSM